MRLLQLVKHYIPGLGATIEQQVKGRQVGYEITPQLRVNAGFGFKAGKLNSG